jgi:hypothetical protein
MNMREQAIREAAEQLHAHALTMVHMQHEEAHAGLTGHALEHAQATHERRGLPRGRPRPPAPGGRPGGSPPGSKGRGNTS